MAPPILVTFTFTLLGVWRFLADKGCIYICTLVFAIDVLQFEALVTFTDVAAKCVNTLSKLWTLSHAQCTLIYIHTGFLVWTEPETP